VKYLVKDGDPTVNSVCCCDAVKPEKSPHMTEVQSLVPGRKLCITFLYSCRFTVSNTAAVTVVVSAKGISWCASSRQSVVTGSVGCCDKLSHGAKLGRWRQDGAVAPLT
jgi:hypothetical protein